MAQGEFFTIEDGDNIARILQHHLGLPPTSLLDREQYEALESDLLRYCTRLRCQPDTKAHGTVPAHQLVTDG